MRHESYVAVIRRASDGVERRVDGKLAWDTAPESEQNDWFWWSEGNYSCDCNRFLEFARAGGENPALDDPRVQCGDGAYLVVRFEFPDGSSIPGPDAE